MFSNFKFNEEMELIFTPLPSYEAFYDTQDISDICYGKEKKGETLSMEKEIKNEEEKEEERWKEEEEIKEKEEKEKEIENAKTIRKNQIRVIKRRIDEEDVKARFLTYLLAKKWIIERKSTGNHILIDPQFNSFYCSSYDSPSKRHKTCIYFPIPTGRLTMENRIFIEKFFISLGIYAERYCFLIVKEGLMPELDIFDFSMRKFIRKTEEIEPFSGKRLFALNANGIAYIWESLYYLLLQTNFYEKGQIDLKDYIITALQKSYFTYDTSLSDLVKNYQNFPKENITAMKKTRKAMITILENQFKDYNTKKTP